MLKLLTLATTIVLAIALSAESLTQTSAPKIQRATWTEGTDTSFGISRDDFKAMGLFKLTREEYGKVLTWDYLRVKDATEKGKATNSSATYSCGRTFPDDASLAKINLLVQTPSESPSELVSGVNQKLRSMADVQIVYDSNDADLIVSVLGYANVGHPANLDVQSLIFS